MAGVLLKRSVRLDHFLDELVDAAVSALEAAPLGERAATERRDLEARLRERFRDILRLDMVVGEQCGLSILCHEAALMEPWSEEAERALREDEEAKE
jgi:hypothetical protein